MNQSYKTLVLGLMLVMAGQSLYSAAAGNSSMQEDDIQAFLRVARAGYDAAVIRFLDDGMDVNARDRHGMTALIGAAEGGHLDIVVVFLFLHADVNAATTYGQTALMAAAKGGHLEIVRLLLDKDANVNAANKRGLTALMAAVEDGHLKVVQLLLDRGADVNAVDNQGRTVLMQAVKNGHLEIVKLLLDKGAHVNAQDSRGWTALMYAAEGGHLKVVQLLLAHGADVNAVDNQGRIALRIAAIFGHLKIVQLLLVRGADSTPVDFSRPIFAPVAAVFRAQREDLAVELPRPFQQILDAYREFQAGRPQRLKELLGIPVSGQNMLMNMQQGKSSAQHRPYVARVEALLGPSRRDLEEVFKENCIAQLLYYLKTGKFADTREQAERFLGWPQPALAKTVDEMMPVEDPRPRALPSESEPTFDTPKAPSSDYVPQAALFGDMNMPD